MAYFTNFPYIQYTFPNNEDITIKNLSIRPSISSEVFDDGTPFESYTIQDGDTPETIAYDVYDDVTYHWIIMLANNILNLYDDWPKTTTQFDLFLLSKYRDSENEDPMDTRRYVEFVGDELDAFEAQIGNRTARPHHFEDINNIEYNYDTVVNGGTDAFGRSYVLPDVTPVSIYEYEEGLNERRRVLFVPSFEVAQRLNNELRTLTNGR